MDSIQAAILLPKLKAFIDYELNDINKVASWYTEDLRNTGLLLPTVPNGFYSSWAQYSIQLPDWIDRSKFQLELKKSGIPSMVYYAKPMHLQAAFKGTDSEAAECPVTSDICSRVLSLPLDPYKTKDEITYITDQVKIILDSANVGE